MINGFCVYIHRFSNGTIYIGKGRLKRAMQMINSRRNSYWSRLFDKYGRPKVRIIVSGVSEDLALHIEERLIDLAVSKRKSLCNITLYNHPKRMPAESRMKMSQPRFGSDNPNYGNTMSQESRNSISKANKGRFIGSNSPRYNKKIYEFIHDEHGTVKCTQHDLRKKINANSSQISNLCSGKAKSCKGWRLSSTSHDDIGKASGRRHGMYDHTVFNFTHKDGTQESCTKYDLAKKYDISSPSNLTTLCKGRIKTYKGWSVDLGYIID